MVNVGGGGVTPTPREGDVKFSNFSSYVLVKSINRSLGGLD